MSESELHLSSILAKKGYMIRSHLGQGSYSYVYEVEKISNGLSFAAKALYTDKAPENFCKKFFPRELMAIQHLKHPHIIEVEDVIESGSLVIIIMHKACGDLLDYVVSKGHLSHQDAAQKFRQVLSAVGYCHNMGVVHRDLKAENILLDDNGDVKLTDFGFCRLFSSSPEGEVRSCLSNTYCGSRAYAAPEVLMGETYDPRLSDVWSLGVLLYVMLTGNFPFEDENLRRMVLLQQTRRWNFPPEQPSLPLTCRLLVERLLEPDINNRPSIRDVMTSDWLCSSESNMSVMQVSPGSTDSTQTRTDINLPRTDTPSRADMQSSTDTSSSTDISDTSLCRADFSLARSQSV